MRVNKWVILVAYLFIFLYFGYLSISEFNKGGNFGLLMGICSFVGGYQVIKWLAKIKKEGINNKEVIVDQRITSIILISLSISYIYIVIFLSVGLFGLYNNYISIEPILMMILAILTSVIVFSISQIVQRFIR